MGTIAKQPDERVVEFLQQELGDTLRVVSWFDGDGCDPLFVRDDLGRTRSTRAIADRCERVLPRIEDRQIDALLPGVAGDTKSLLMMDDTVVVLLLYRTDAEGIVVSFDQSGDSPLTSFIQDCLTLLR